VGWSRLCFAPDLHCRLSSDQDQMVLVLVLVVSTHWQMLFFLNAFEWS
jgi:hypothetical protein